jgi:hypothetical protein
MPRRRNPKKQKTRIMPEKARLRETKPDEAERKKTENLLRRREEEAGKQEAAAILKTSLEPSGSFVVVRRGARARQMWRRELF